MSRQSPYYQRQAEARATARVARRMRLHASCAPLVRKGRCVGVLVGDTVTTHNREGLPSDGWEEAGIGDVPDELVAYALAAVRRAHGTP